MNGFVLEKKNKKKKLCAMKKKMSTKWLYDEEEEKKCVDQVNEKMKSDWKSWRWSYF